MITSLRRATNSISSSHHMSIKLDEVDEENDGEWLKFYTESWCERWWGYKVCDDCDNGLLLNEVDDHTLLGLCGVTFVRHRNY